MIHQHLHWCLCHYVRVEKSMSYTLMQFALILVDRVSHYVILHLCFLMCSLLILSKPPSGSSPISAF